MNWVDLLIIVFLAIYGYRGWRRGFVSMALGLVALLLPVGIAALLYSPLAIVVGLFGASEGTARALAFLMIWFAGVVLLSIAAKRWYATVPKETLRSQANRIGGIFPGIIEGIILIAFVLLLIVVVPGNPGVRTSVQESAIARPLIVGASAVQRVASSVFGEAVQSAVQFVTIAPSSNDRIELNYKTTDVRVDEDAERQMLEMVNRERMAKGLKPLVRDEQLTELARDYSREMFANGYFAHVDSSGHSPFDRMRAAGIRFHTAGENLALAPNVDVAHKGLMNSPGHRANILSPDYHRIGIGAVASDVRGTMFSQEFTN